MAEPVPIAFGRGSNKAEHPQAGQAEFVNAYIKELGEAGKVGFTAEAINGLELFATLTGAAGGVRAGMEFDTQLLVVCGRLLFSTNQGGSPIIIVGGIPSDGPVTMAANRKKPSRQVCLVSDGLVFLYEGGTLTQLFDPDLPPPIAVLEIDGFFVFLIADGRWFIAGPNEGSDIDPLDFTEAQASADANVGGIVRGRTLIIFGTQSCEFVDPVPDPTFPFARTAAINVGCLAAGSIKRVLVQRGGRAVDTVIFAATDQEGAYAGVMALDGYTPVPISTPEVDRLIRDEPDKRGLRAMGWTEDGRPFYAISGTSFTMVWDGKTGEWHGRRSKGLLRWRGGAHIQFGEKAIIGHYDSNKLYVSKSTVYAEDGDDILWQIQPPPIHMYPKGFLLNELHVDMVTGVGNNGSVAGDADPELVISASRDGGVTFGSQRRAKLGTQGQRSVRVKQGTWGNFDHNGAVLRFSCSAAVAKAMQQLAIVAKPTRR